VIGEPRGSNLLKRTKTSLLAVARRVGAFRLVAESEWRRQRLLVLCYHGVSLLDEHEWNPLLYISPDTFRRRLDLLRRRACNVLPLGEALHLLHEGRLPERAVTITFDDGHYDFHAVAHPLLTEYGYPATVYLTTYHVDCNIPIFALACSYMLWKGRSLTLDLTDLGGGRAVALTSPGMRRAALNVLVEAAERQGLTALEKNRLAADLAGRLQLDFESLCRNRFLHLMNAEEVTALARTNVDFQLHSHCHRAPLTEPLYREQIQRNRVRVEQLTGGHPVHFCYPSGVTAPEFIPWLRAEGIVSATTTIPGLAAAGDHPLLLPRILDHSGLSCLEFDGWRSGFAALLPRSTTEPGNARELPRAKYEAVRR